MWVVLGDRYAGYANGGPSVPRSSLLGLPWRVAHALSNRRWLLRNAITWHGSRALARALPTWDGRVRWEGGSRG